LEIHITIADHFDALIRTMLADAMVQDYELDENGRVRHHRARQRSRAAIGRPAGQPRQSAWQSCASCI
jgi:hypothetical protein